MINIENAEIIDILPSFFTSKPDVVAFSAALKAGLQITNKYAERTMMYANIDKMPEYILDYMAIEMNADYYSEKYDIEKKRTIIKKSLYWKMKAGSNMAIEELIQAIFGEGEVIEFFNYTEGEKTPGTFDVNTSAVMTPDIIEKFNILLKNIKRGSQHLRKIEAIHRINGKIALGSVLVQDSIQSL
ncbi:MAG: phage tail protein [Eubacteriales bacterium]|nr:phage tail protein [Eubacteriales bacterium]